jgi:peptide/nickel transport system permease protein
LRNYILRRILNVIIILLILSVFIFLMIRLIPGDPARVLAGEHASEKAIEALRHQLGLDKPIFIQFFSWFGRVIRGDFGDSIFTHQPILQDLLYRFPNTFELAIFAMIFATLIGVFAGIISAVKRYSIFDYASMMVALVGVSMPVFWLGIMLILIFGVKLDLLPTGGRLSVYLHITPITHFYLLDSLLQLNFAAFFDLLKHLILPAIALGTIPMAFIARITRSSMLNVMNQDYIRTAKSKGLKTSTVIMKHALKNALIPILTASGTEFALLMGGAILTETIFSWPGIGTYVVLAVQSRDYPAVQGSVLFIALVVALINLIVDILYAYVDPRIHYQ